MESSLRIEVQELVHACKNLAGSARQNNGALTNEECDRVADCVQTLEKSVLPSHAVSDQPLASTLGALSPVID